MDTQDLLLSSRRGQSQKLQEIYLLRKALLLAVSGRRALCSAAFDIQCISRESCAFAQVPTWKFLGKETICEDFG